LQTRLEVLRVLTGLNQSLSAMGETPLWSQPGAPTRTGMPKTGGNVIGINGRRKIAAAQKARWAKIRAAKKTTAA